MLILWLLQLACYLGRIIFCLCYTCFVPGHSSNHATSSWCVLLIAMCLLSVDVCCYVLFCYVCLALLQLLSLACKASPLLH